MGNEIEDKRKKRGHRKRKFGDEESKVISFRIGKDTYKRNKKRIRKKINTIIESENFNEKPNRIEPEQLKEDKQKPSDYFERFKHKNKKKQAQKDEEKVFVIDRELYNQRDYKKEFIETNEPELTEGDKLNLREYYEQYRGSVKEQVQEDVNRKNAQDTKDFKKKKELFEEFKEFIDKDNKEFKEFMD